MDPFIPNFQSALQLVINFPNILRTNLKSTSSKPCTSAQTISLRSFRPKLEFCCLKPWNEEQPVLKLYPEGKRTENTWPAVRNKFRVWESYNWWWHLQLV